MPDDEDGDREKMEEVEHEAILTGLPDQELCPCGCGYPKGMINNPPGRNCKLLVGCPVSTLTPNFEITDGKGFPDGDERPLIGSWRCDFHIKTLSELTLDQARSLLTMERRDGTKARDKWYDWGQSGKRPFMNAGVKPKFPEPLYVRLDYPLSEAAHVVIHPSTKKIVTADETRERPENYSPGQVAWIIAQTYVAVYADHEKYGIWGHGMGDLYLVSLSVREDGLVGVGMGS